MKDIDLSDAPTRSPPPITIPGMSVTWGMIGALCLAIVLSVGGGFWGLINLVYGNIDRRISDVQSNVGDLQKAIVSSARDAGSLQILLNEAPELRKNIQDTHDAVMSYAVRFDNIDKSIGALNSNVADINERLARADKQLPKR
jgi:peptidoglycan hydrolase CwlO-like protein